MLNLTQLKSQSEQLLSFYKIVPLSRILQDSLIFPFEYFGYSGRASFPWAVNLLVTARCNLHCEMCRVNAEQFWLTNDELTLSDIKSFVMSIAKKKTHIFLSGGEPFIREDIFELIDSVTKSGLTWGTCTNGTLLDREKIANVVKLNPAFIIFSLHGTQEAHDKVTGIHGSFDKSCNNITTLLSLKKMTKVIINCTITDSNLSQLGRLIKIAETLGVDILRFQHLNFITKTEAARNCRMWGEEFPEENNVPWMAYAERPDGYDKFRDSIAALRTQIKKSKVAIRLRPFLQNNELDSWYSGNFKTNRKCFFAWRSLFILPNGDVNPCEYINYKIGNIKVDRLDNLWNSKKYQDFRLRLKRGIFPACARCCKL